TRGDSPINASASPVCLLVAVIAPPVSQCSGRSFEVRTNKVRKTDHPYYEREGRSGCRGPVSDSRGALEAFYAEAERVGAVLIRAVVARAWGCRREQQDAVAREAGSKIYRLW